MIKVQAFHKKYKVTSNFAAHTKVRIIKGKKYPASRVPGTDYATNTGEDVYAVENGEVRLEPSSKWAGAVVVSLETPRRKYFFVHLSKMTGKSPRTVQAGEVIGQTGMTGKATGAHTHVCVLDRKTGKFIDIEKEMASAPLIAEYKKATVKVQEPIRPIEQPVVIKPIETPQTNNNSNLTPYKPTMNEIEKTLVSKMPNTFKYSSITATLTALIGYFINPLLPAEVFSVVLGLLSIVVNFVVVIAAHYINKFLAKEGIEI